MRSALLLLLLSVPLGPVALAADCESRDPTTAEVNSREGVRLAKAGEFEAAIALFRTAIRLDTCAPEHQLLLARALARADKRDESRTLYLKVMDEYPSTPAGKRAESELAELMAKPESEPVPPTRPDDPTALTATPPPADETPWGLIGYSTAGVGVAALATGVFFALDAQKADDDLEGAARGTDRGRYDELVDQRDQSGTLAYVFYSVGGALVVGGLAAALLLPTTTSETGETSVTAGADAQGRAYFGLQGVF